MTEKQKFSGIAEYVDGPKPPHMTYSFKVNGTRYGTYKTPPGIKQGDNISFYATEKGGFWNADVKSIGVVPDTTANPSVSSNSVSAAVGGARSGSVNSYDSRQDSITYQSARKDALTFLTLLQTTGSLDLGKAKTKASMIEVLETYVDKYTERFVEDTKNLGHKIAVDTDGVSLADVGGLRDELPFG